MGSDRKINFRTKFGRVHLACGCILLAPTTPGWLERKPTINNSSKTLHKSAFILGQNLSNLQGCRQQQCNNEALHQLLADEVRQMGCISHMLIFWGCATGTDLQGCRQQWCDNEALHQLLADEVRQMGCISHMLIFWGCAAGMLAKLFSKQKMAYLRSLIQT
jgi:hypothetical protein